MDHNDFTPTAPRKQYPLHPGQTHAEPYYCTIPLEEYEAIMKENARMKEALKRHGITLFDIDESAQSDLLHTCTQCGRKTTNPIYIKQPEAPNPMCKECAWKWQPKR